MLHRNAMIAALVVTPLLASCAGQEIAPHQTVKGEALLAKRLAGTTAGPAVNCLSRYRSADMEVVDSDTILFHDGRTTYRQDTNGSCYPYGRQSGYALVTRNFGGGGGLCDGDIAQVIDTTGGIYAGTCSFNAFVPYRRP
ncbi:MAG TPA: hypothetical protein VNI79_06470 [Sphingomicrobium sp.]|nr:hypothetical protein [Sphingomicrobium sp.]